MATVVRLFSVPSTGLRISLVEHKDYSELIIRSETGHIRRRRLEPRTARALINSLDMDKVETVRTDTRPRRES